MNPSELAATLHYKYEEFAKEFNWDTKKECKVDFDNLPKENKAVMLKLTEWLLLSFILKSRVVDLIGDHNNCRRTGIIEYHKGSCLQDVNKKLFEDVDYNGNE